MNNNTNNNFNSNKLGALWEKKSQKGYTYFLGNITINGKKTDIFIIKNNKKDNDKSPDYTIMESKKK